MRDLRLHVNGREYGGWKEARVTRSIEAIAGGFELAVTDRWAGQDEPWPIQPEDECRLTIDGEPVIMGYVDGGGISYDAHSHSMRVRGHDKAGALVECSADVGAWEFRNASLATLATRLAEPFAVTVGVQAGLSFDPVAKLALDPGETAFEALERACRMAGALAVSDGNGGITLTRAGSARASTALVEGENILAFESDWDRTDCHRAYRVIGQHQGSDTASGPVAASVRGEARDMTVRRMDRVLLVRAEGNVTRAQAARRAEWEATVRAARGYTVRVRVHGWHQRDGRLWPVNALVPIRSPRARLDAELLISEVNFALDAGGATTTLTLRRPDAFTPEPLIQPSKTKGVPWAELARGV